METDLERYAFDLLNIAGVVESMTAAAKHDPNAVEKMRLSRIRTICELVRDSANRTVIHLAKILDD